MTLAVWKDLCLDAADAALVGAFWAGALGQGLEVLEDGDALVRGPAFADLWVNTVPEPKVTKNRVHLDLYAADLAPLLDLGATVVARHDEWTVLADPEGNEMCVFPGDSSDAPARVFALCVDSARPVELAAWWHGLLGGSIGPGSDGRPRWLHGAAGLEGLIMKAVQVDDERVVKNRCHWDVTTAAVDDLVAAGATVLRHPDDAVRWAVCADPQGNEFCAFTTS